MKIKINVYSYAFIDAFTQTIIPLYISKIDALHTINILRFENHYFYIKNFNRLCGSKLMRENEFCPNCLTGYRTRNELKKHSDICNKFKPTKVLMPKEKYYEFTDFG